MPLAESSSSRCPPEKLAPDGLPRVDGEDSRLASPPVVPGLPATVSEYVSQGLPATWPRTRVPIAGASHDEGEMNELAAEVPAGQMSRLDRYGGPEVRIEA